MIAQSSIEKRRLRDYNVRRTVTMTAIGFLFTVKLKPRLYSNKYNIIIPFISIRVLC